MIFSGNTTALSASTIPMAEGYDCSYGVGLALVEAARNDLSMFKAMVQADYKEMAICNESTGVVMEGEIAALHEAVGGGIFKKIADLFRKLIAKIKSIFHNFLAKIRGLYMKDKELVKKYEKELARKRNLDKLEVKWRKDKNADSFTDKINVDSFIDGFNRNSDAYTSEWKEDSWERCEFFINKFKLKVQADSTSDLINEIIDACLDVEEIVELKEIGGWRKIAMFISDYDKIAKKVQSEYDKLDRKLEKMVKEYDKAANDTVKSGKEVYSDKKSTDADKKAADDKTENANKTYDMAQAYQTVLLASMQAYIQVNTLMYKYNKAAFMKAVTINEKKLEESSIYAEAVAEAAADEVDAVINSALSKEEISDLSSANTSVLDGDAKDDPDYLTHDYSTNMKNASWNTSVGTVDSEYNSKEESAYFGTMFY